MLITRRQRSAAAPSPSRACGPQLAKARPLRQARYCGRSSAKTGDRAVHDDAADLE